MHPADRAAHARAFAPLISGQVEEVRLRHRYVTADGVTRWADVRARLARDADGLPHGVAGVIEDVTAGHRSQQYEAAEQAIVDVLMRAEDLETGVGALLECLCHHLDWDLAELWTYDAEAEALICTDAAGERRDGLEALEAARAGRAFEIGDGLPVRRGRGARRSGPRRCTTTRCSAAGPRRSPPACRRRSPCRSRAAARCSPRSCSWAASSASRIRA